MGVGLGAAGALLIGRNVHMHEIAENGPRFTTTELISAGNACIGALPYSHDGFLYGVPTACEPFAESFDFTDPSHATDGDPNNLVATDFSHWLMPKINEAKQADNFGENVSIAGGAVSGLVVGLAFRKISA
jgi:hypothetical protein